MSMSYVNLDPDKICFGLNRETDECSLASFLRIFSSPEMLEVLIPRLSDEEITNVLNFLTGIMHSHFSEKEYHTYFLGRD